MELGTVIGYLVEQIMGAAPLRATSSQDLVSDRKTRPYVIR